MEWINGHAVRAEAGWWVRCRGLGVLSTVDRSGEEPNDESPF